MSSSKGSRLPSRPHLSVHVRCSHSPRAAYHRQVCPLVGLVPSLKLDVFSVRGEERAFGTMLAKVSEQMFRHAGDQVLVAKVGVWNGECGRAVLGRDGSFVKLPLCQRADVAPRCGIVYFLFMTSCTSDPPSRPLGRWRAGLLCRKGPQRTAGG